ncbi:hypothetical protein QZH41_016729 [Actinostola sp. cb2023]|nr:hypothetical protein QZH41_016729 [Actinostola sp. cb2023]
MSGKPMAQSYGYGHGKVVMIIMEYNPDLTMADCKGRTASAFASAMDNIWPFFAAAGCKRTPKSELIAKDIVKKVPSKEVGGIPQNEKAYFSRPGSAYVIKTQSLHGTDRAERPSIKEQKEDIAFCNGDVLTEGDSPVRHGARDSPSFNVWRN